MDHAPIISRNIRVRHPDYFEVGEGSIVDDFCYFSTRIKIGRFSHIASGCSIAGGGDRTCSVGDFSSLSSGVKIWCTSDDFSRDVVTVIPRGCGMVKENLIVGDVILCDVTAVGANTVVMPRNTIPEGTVIGALSFVPADYPFEAWMVYAGAPIRPVKKRDRDSVLRQLERLNGFLS